MGYISVEDLIQIIPDKGIQGEVGTRKSISNIRDHLPDDLYQVIGKKGHRYHDDLTKASLYCLQKLKNSWSDNPDETGVIFATSFGNYRNGYQINQLSHDSKSKFSAQIFPNSTFSSASVAVSIALKARGLNLTVNSGETSFCSAIAQALHYFNAGKISHCFVFAAEDFAEYPYQCINNQCRKNMDLISSAAALSLGLSVEPSRGCCEIIGAHFALSQASVWRYLDNLLSNRWRKEYSVHAAGSGSLDCLSSLSFVKDTTNCHLSWGASTGLLQLIDVLENTRDRNTEGTVILTSAFDGSLGCVVIRRSVGYSKEIK